jgi:hypothetical protein
MQRRSAPCRSPAFRSALFLPALFLPALFLLVLLLLVLAFPPVRPSMFLEASEHGLANAADKFNAGAAAFAHIIPTQREPPTLGSLISRRPCSTPLLGSIALYGC